ncbi:hypothetical protein M9H77_06806 [Catharanthus roseus]|uniref:Uncharacterized protein n=1 Tax=Catharanthus roseus TaxID=4058 RepID=A0ACC0BT50_CATRO|nr:hypothetical protein M9H77_06806 [Catharanthus roseus]
MRGRASSRHLTSSVGGGSRGRSNRGKLKTKYTSGLKCKSKRKKRKRKSQWTCARGKRKHEIAIEFKFFIGNCAHLNLAFGLAWGSNFQFKSGIGRLGKRNSNESEHIFDHHSVSEIKNLTIDLACECGGAIKSRTKPRVDNEEEEEVPIERLDPYGTKKCGCPFKLKGEQMATSENWQLFVHNGSHNHKIGVYNHGHAQAARQTKEQLIQTEQFRKSNVPPRNILRFF